MKTLLLTPLVFLLLASCVWRHNQSSESVPGTYELIQFDGLHLPVELSDGRTLVAGSCLLRAGMPQAYQAFDLAFSYEGELQEGRTGLANHYGEYDVRTSPDGLPYLHFWVADPSFWVPDVLWETDGAVSGNSLTIHLEEGEAVFHKRR